MPLTSRLGSKGENGEGAAIPFVDTPLMIYGLPMMLCVFKFCAAPNSISGEGLRHYHMGQQGTIKAYTTWFLPSY